MRAPGAALEPLAVEVVELADQRLVPRLVSPPPQLHPSPQQLPPLGARGDARDGHRGSRLGRLQAPGRGVVRLDLQRVEHEVAQGHVQLGLLRLRLVGHRLRRARLGGALGRRQHLQDAPRPPGAKQAEQRAAHRAVRHAALGARARVHELRAIAQVEPLRPARLVVRLRRRLLQHGGGLLGHAAPPRRQRRLGIADFIHTGAALRRLQQ